MTKEAGVPRRQRSINPGATALHGTRIQLVAVGDLSFNGRYSARLRRLGADYPFRSLIPSWHSSDLLIGNLESPVTRAPRTSASKCVLRTSTEALEALRSIGMHCVNLANNHAMDFGEQGLVNTMDALRDYGIPYTGAGENDETAGRPVLLTINQQTIGIFGFCDVRQGARLYAGHRAPGVAALTSGDVVSKIRNLRPQVDWIIVHFHWGHEMSQLPSPAQRKLAREAVAAGADVIVGHHPHVLQPIEHIGNSVVAYSLGNFTFSDMYWKGTKACGERFWSKLRLHPLSRQTGWLECTLQKGSPVAVKLHFAILNRQLAVVPDPSPLRRKTWDELCAALHQHNYADLVCSEVSRARARHDWRWNKQTLTRRAEMILFRLGLLGRESEGFE